MPRIAKSDVVASLERAAATIRSADTNGNGVVSRAEMAAKVKTLDGTEKALVDIFFKFTDHRDYKKFARVTGADLAKSVAYAAKEMVSDYDVNNNGLSQAEVSKMSTTGKLAVEWAAEFKSAGVRTSAE